MNVFYVSYRQAQTCSTQIHTQKTYQYVHSKLIFEKSYPIRSNNFKRKIKLIGFLH